VYLAAWLNILASVGVAQIISRVPPNFKFDGAIDDWTKHGGRTIGQDDQGLVVSGASLFSSLGPASTAYELATKGRLELWMSGDDTIEMPPISWLAGPMTERSCAEPPFDTGDKQQHCLQWFDQQPAHRQRVLSLFTRMWRIAPGLAEEVYATRIFDSMSDAEKKSVAPLKPSGEPVAKFAFDKFKQRFTFEIRIPWEAFPPSARLHQERVRFALNVVEGERFSALLKGPGDQSLDEPNFQSYALSPAVVAHFTPCEYPLATTRGEPIFYLVNQSMFVKSAFVLRSPSPGRFTTEPPRSDVFAPLAIPIEHFVQKLGADEFLCSPPLSYRRGSVTKQLDLQLAPGEDFYDLKPPMTTLPVIRLPNGTRLLKNGPTSAFRMQSHTQCGGCPVTTLQMFSLSPVGELKQVLSLGERVGGLEAQGYEIEVSRDWKTVTEFRLVQAKWTSKKFCFNGISYLGCGEKQGVAPPKRGSAP
jgi:hypothetical protein